MLGHVQSLHEEDLREEAYVMCVMTSNTVRKLGGSRRASVMRVGGQRVFLTPVEVECRLQVFSWLDLLTVVNPRVGAGPSALAATHPIKSRFFVSNQRSLSDHGASLRRKGWKFHSLF